MAQQLRRPAAIALDLLVDAGRLRISNRTCQQAGTIADKTARRLEELDYAHHLEVVAVPTDAGRQAVANGIQLPPYRYRHGTHACYTLDGCRCDRCRHARTVYERDRTRRTIEGRPPTVDAEPVRQHVRQLMDAGVGLKTIAARSGVAHGTLWKLIYGAPDRPGPSRRVRTVTAERLYTVGPGDLADGALVPSGPTRRRLREMRSGGFTGAELARYLTGNPAAKALQIGEGRKVTVGHARQVHQLWGRWKDGQIVPRGRRNRHRHTGPAPTVPLETQEATHG